MCRTLKAAVLASGVVLFIAAGLAGAQADARRGGRFVGGYGPHHRGGHEVGGRTVHHPLRALLRRL